MVGDNDGVGAVGDGEARVLWIEDALDDDRAAKAVLDVGFMMSSL